MRRWLLDLHLYLGLVCLPYTVLLGVSSLLLNHDVERSASSHWEQPVTAALAGDDASQATALRDALGLRGDVLAHTLARTADGTLRFQVMGPGREHKIALGADGVARVDETDHGVIGVLRGLHGRRGLAGAEAWGASWGLYTDLTTFSLLFAIGTGLVLFWPRRAERWLGAGAAGLGMVVAALLAGGMW